MAKQNRGSKKHILDWVECTDFTDQLSELLHPTDAVVQSTDTWMPKGYNNPNEARLEQFGPHILSTINWQTLQDWWFAYKPGANTPNWDLASTCTIQGRQGLVLVEAKSHAQELETAGKRLESTASINSRKNHDHIGQAIKQASDALGKVIPGINISLDTHYQLANRVAYSWKIASLGIPVVLVYLGFLGDKNISDVGKPFIDDNNWLQVMRTYRRDQIPEDFTERWIYCGKESMQMIIRSLPVKLKSG
jgi:hypothetical protein